MVKGNGARPPGVIENESTTKWGRSYKNAKKKSKIKKQKNQSADEVVKKVLPAVINSRRLASEKAEHAAACE